MLIWPATYPAGSEQPTKGCGIKAPKTWPSVSEWFKTSLRTEPAYYHTQSVHWSTETHLVVQLLLGVQCLQVEEILLEQVNVGLQEGLAKCLRTKQNWRKRTDITMNIRPVRQNIIFTLIPEQTPGSLCCFSVQQSNKTGSCLSQLCCCQTNGSEEILVETWSYLCRTVAKLGLLGTGGPRLHWRGTQMLSTAPLAASLLVKDLAVSPGCYLRQHSKHEQNQNTHTGFVLNPSQKTKVTGRCMLLH